MARWSGLDVESDKAELIKAMHALRATHLPPGYVLGGFVKFNGSGGQAVVGSRACLEIEPVCEVLWPLLQLGSRTGAGGHAIYGFGAYRCQGA